MRDLDPRLSSSSDFRCVFRRNDITIHVPQPAYCARQPNITSCRAEEDVIRACPLVAQYHSLHTRGSLTVRLRSVLASQHVAILGDSMSRQVWHVGVSRLRGESVMLDPKLWNMMRYRFRTAHDGVLSDCLEPLYDPTNLRYQDPCWGAHQWQSAAGPPARPRAELSLVWVPMPLWSSVSTAISLVRAAQNRSAAPFSAFLVMLPSLWQLDHPEPALRSGAFEVPSYFWEHWRQWDEESAASGRPPARYAALTQPLQALGCIKGLGGWFTHNQALARLHNITVASTLCYTPAKGAFAHVPNQYSHCCRLGAIHETNRLVGLPSNWRKVDFSGLVAAEVAARGWMPLLANPDHNPSRNWHYECYMSEPTADFGTESVQVGNSWRKHCKDKPIHWRECMQFYERFFDTQRDLSWTPRETGDCGERGNTMLWEHLIDSAVANDIFARTR